MTVGNLQEKLMVDIISAVAYATRSLAAAATNSSNIQSVITDAYSTAGDGGGAVYVYSASGVTTGGFSDAGGRAYNLAPWIEKRFEMFGAKGDGSTDDTTALNAAIGAGYRIDTVAGRVYMTQPTLTTNVPVFIGGRGTIKLLPSSSAAPMLTLQSGAAGSTISCILDGNYATQPHVQYTTVALDIAAPGVDLSGITVQNTSCGAMLLRAGADNIKIIGSVFTNCGEAALIAINFGGACPNGGLVKGCTFINCAAASIAGGSRWIFDTNYILIYNSRAVPHDNTYGLGIEFFEDGAGQAFCVATNNIVDGAGCTHAFGISATGQYQMVTGNIVMNCGNIGIECMDGVFNGNIVINSTHAMAGSLANTNALTITGNVVIAPLAFPITALSWSSAGGGTTTVTVTGDASRLVPSSGTGGIVADQIEMQGVVSTGGSGAGYNNRFLNIISATLSGGSTILVVADPQGSSPGTYSSGGYLNPLNTGYQFSNSLNIFSFTVNTYSGSGRAMDINSVNRAIISGNDFYLYLINEFGLLASSVHDAQIRNNRITYLNTVDSNPGVVSGIFAQDCAYAAIVDNYVDGFGKLYRGFCFGVSAGSSFSNLMSGNSAVNISVAPFQINADASTYFTNNRQNRALTSNIIGAGVKSWGNVDITNSGSTWSTNAGVTTEPVLFANLPSSAPDGTHAFITDSTIAFSAATIGTTTAGGGGNASPVIRIGGVWKVGG